jgi:hypothetical protein
VKAEDVTRKESQTHREHEVSQEQLQRSRTQKGEKMMGQQQGIVAGSATLLRCIRQMLVLWGRTSVPFFKA